jgi:hypothetical protein
MSAICPGDGVCCPSLDCRLNPRITCEACHVCSSTTGKCEHATDGTACEMDGKVCISGVCVNDPALVGKPCLEPVGSYGRCLPTDGDGGCKLAYGEEKFLKDKCLGDAVIKCCVSSSYPVGKPCGHVNAGDGMGACRWLVKDPGSGVLSCPDPGQTPHPGLCLDDSSAAFQCCIKKVVQPPAGESNVAAVQPWLA